MKQILKFQYRRNFILKCMYSIFCIPLGNFFKTLGQTGSYKYENLKLSLKLQFSYEVSYKKFTFPKREMINIGCCNCYIWLYLIFHLNRNKDDPTFFKNL